MSNIPVVAAIPHYNMVHDLDRLLATVTTQDYSHVYVLDDCSSQSLEDIIRKYPSVTFVASQKNGGAGAARNAILRYVSTETYIHFLDADVELQSATPAHIIQELFREHPLQPI